MMGGTDRLTDHLAIRMPTKSPARDNAMKPKEARVQNKERDHSLTLMLISAYGSGNKYNKTWKLERKKWTNKKTNKSKE